MAIQYFPVLILFLSAMAIGGTAWVLASIFGPKHSNSAKEAPFECGNPSFGTKGKKFSVKFYIVAMLFLVFDLECVFLYPWAVHYQKLGIFGFVEMFIFIAVLFICYVYVWKKGALEWE